GFFVDVTRCTGCRACEVACNDKNRLSGGMRFRNAHTYSVGSFPDVRAFSCTFSCNHCDEPACVANCPTGDMFKSEDGAVLHQDDVCIGCKTCVNSCPYQVPVIDEEQGISRKCNSCIAIRTASGQPACVAG
ncbi:4Fe-4S dicluster domain-containing protein, partial [Adlercreutzia equolifaciens]|uniref:4Fe-4S dicluster domain-containing protein n=1 Tax=Adlercreutzia equolifaciens TaxID=446660 RepID=UPI0023AE83E7